MATEEQTNVNTLNNGLSSGTSAGQRLTITNRTVSKLSFHLAKTGTPGGTLTLLIRAVSGDGILATKAWGNSNDISTTPTWYEVTFDSAVAIDEEVYILALASAGTGGAILAIYGSYPDDVKADEYAVTRTGAGVYSNQTDRDMGYKYTYVTSGELPTVTAQRLADISGTTATGWGTIVSTGTSSVTQHGFCWATTIDPTTADSKTTDGAGSLGVFSSSITVLTVNQQYFVRPYATNTEGTAYGANIRFRAGSISSQLLAGQITVKETNIQYVDKYGVERYLTGPPV